MFNQPNQGGGLFGQGGQTNAFTSNAPSTGLFSSNSDQAQAAKIGIFGTQNSDNKSGLFGGNNLSTTNTQGQSQTSGIFNNNSSTTATTSNTANTGGGLFGKQPSFGTAGSIGTNNLATTTASTTPSNPLSGGLFGNNNSQPTTNTPSFNNQNTTTAQGPPITSMPSFGDISSPKADQKKGLLGNLSAPTTAQTNPTGGLFNQNTTSTTATTTFPATTNTQKTTPSTSPLSAPTGGLFSQNNQTNLTTPSTQPAQNTSISFNNSGNTNTNQPTLPKTGLGINPPTQQYQPQQNKQSKQSGGLFAKSPTLTTTTTTPLVGNPSRMQQTKINPPASQPGSSQNQEQKLNSEIQRSGKTVGEYVDEWRKLLVESYRELAFQCSVHKSYYNQRKQNYTIIKNFEQLSPIVNQDKQAIDQMLDRMEKRQNQVMTILMRIKQELGNDTNSNYSREHPIANLIHGYRNARKQVNAQDEKYSGDQQQDASNQQLRNIFFNLDSVESEIRRLNHALDHYFNKATY